MTAEPSVSLQMTDGTLSSPLDITASYPTVTLSPESLPQSAQWPHQIFPFSVKKHIWGWGEGGLAPWMNACASSMAGSSMWQKNKQHISLLSLGLEKLYFSETILQHFYLNLFLGDSGDGSAGKGTDFCASMKI